MKLKPLDIASTLASPPKMPEQVYPGLYAGSLGNLNAPGGTGKSFLAMEFCIAMAAGLPPAGGVFPSSGNPAKAFMLAGEETSPLVSQRLHAIVDSLTGSGQGELYGSTNRAELEALLQKNLVIYPFAGESARLLNANGSDTELLAELKKVCVGARLIVLDPLRRLHDGDENDSGAMTRVVCGLESLAMATGAAVIVVHHSSRAADLNGYGGSQHASRGSTALPDGVRWQANLVAMSEKEAEVLQVRDDRRFYLRLVIPKANYMPPFPAVWMRRQKGGVLVKVSDFDAVQTGQKGKGKPKREWAHV
jgi:RecA-family ATPase